MHFTHVNVTIPPGAEPAARAFYGDLLGLKEIPKPQSMRSRGGLWFDVGGIDIHVSAEESHGGQDIYRHFGLDCDNIDQLRQKITAAGIPTEDGRPAPWKRFFVRDPFGNRIEIHEIGGLRF